MNTELASVLVLDGVTYEENFHESNPYLMQ